MLAALAPASLARLRFPLGELTQARGPRAGARGRPGGRAPSPTRRTSASWPAPAARRSSRATAACASGPGDDRRPRRAASLGAHRGHHGFTVGQRRGLGLAAPASRSTCSPPTRAPTRSRSARARRCAHDARCAARRCACTATRATSTACALRYRSPARAAAGCAATARCELERAVRGRRARARPPACSQRRDVDRRSRADRSRAMTSDEIREPFLSFFEERGHQRLPSASLVPAAYDPSALLTTAGMHPLKPYFLGQETPPRAAADELPEVLPHGRHRQRRQHRPPPDVLRDARQLLDRRLLQAGRGRVRLGALAARASASTPRTSG